ncbi:MAG TPA: hypothetical protein VLW44_17080 [Streptosporangiaceae bacterium]|nr:hypothetical protein [Streptosporangiaceae bacterium]
MLAGTRPVPPGPVDHDLPGHSPAIMAYFSSAPPVDWTDRTSILDGAVAAARVFSGSPQFDAAEAAPTRPVFSTAPVRTRRRRATAC